MKRAEIKCQDGKAEVHIYDVIGNYWGEGISADQFRQDIESLGDVESLTVRINSPGGAVFDGLTMYNALRRLEIPVTAAVDGVAASAAAIVAMGADTVTMSETARMMIHEAMGMSDGRAEDHRAMAERLDSINDSQVGIFMDKAGATAVGIRDMLAAETWFTGPEALSAGFADEVTEALQIAACIPEGQYQNAPPELVLMGSSKTTPEPSPAQIARKKAIDNIPLTD